MRTTGPDRASPSAAAGVGLLLVVGGLALIIVAVWRWSPDAGLAALGAVLCLFGFAFLGWSSPDDPVDTTKGPAAL